MTASQDNGGASAMESRARVFQAALVKGDRVWVNTRNAQGAWDTEDFDPGVVRHLIRAAAATERLARGKALRNEAVSPVNEIADRIEKDMNLLMDEVEKNLLLNLRRFSRNYPTRTFTIRSGHGGLDLTISRRGSGWCVMTGSADYFTVDYDAWEGRCPPNFAAELFTEVNAISVRFQDEFNGYACIQPANYSVKNGYLIEPDLKGGESE
jgi:hypothetical protein